MYSCIRFFKLATGIFYPWLECHQLENWETSFNRLTPKREQFDRDKERRTSDRAGWVKRTRTMPERATMRTGTPDTARKGSQRFQVGRFQVGR